MEVCTMILDFIFQNWLGIIVTLAFIGYIVYLSVTKQWTMVREFAYQVMLLAERTFSDENGSIKFDFVVRIVYRYIPPWLKLFVKEDDVKQLIQLWYDSAKDFLDDGNVNNSTKK